MPHSILSPGLGSGGWTPGWEAASMFMEGQVHLTVIWGRWGCWPQNSRAVLHAWALTQHLPPALHLIWDGVRPRATPATGADLSTHT